VRAADTPTLSFPVPVIIKGDWVVVEQRRVGIREKGLCGVLHNVERKKEFMYRVSSLFKERSINIHELEAWTEDAPFSGRLFKMVATVELPSESNITKLSADIDDLATKVGVDMWLET